MRNKGKDKKEEDSEAIKGWKPKDRQEENEIARIGYIHNALRDKELKKDEQAERMERMRENATPIPSKEGE